MELDGCLETIKAGEVDADEETEYTLVPVWLTEEEYNNLPEANI